MNKIQTTIQYRTYQYRTSIYIFYTLMSLNGVVSKIQYPLITFTTLLPNDNNIVYALYAHNIIMKATLLLLIAKIVINGTYRLK